MWMYSDDSREELKSAVLLFVLSELAAALILVPHEDLSLVTNFFHGARKINVSSGAPCCSSAQAPKVV